MENKLKIITNSMILKVTLRDRLTLANPQYKIALVALFYYCFIIYK